MKTTAKPRNDQANSKTPTGGLSGIVVAAIILLAGIGAFNAIEGLTGKPSEETHFALINGFIFLGLALGTLTAWRNWFINPDTLQRGFDSTLASYAAGASVLIAFLIYWCGIRQIGSYDHSALIDLSYRLANGQKAYVDFPCTVPVGFFLGGKFAFKLFGVEWRSFVIEALIYGLITFWWSLYLLNNLLANRKLALLIALTLQAMSQIDVSYWWYNPITAVAASIFLLSSVHLVYFDRSKSANISQFFAVLLLAAMKPNVAGILLPLTTLILLCVRRLTVRVLTISGASFVAFVGVMFANQLSLSAMVHSYLGVSDRGFSLEQFLQDMGPNEKLMSLLGAAVLVLPAFTKLAQLKTALRSPVSWIMLVGLLAGIYGFITDGESKTVDLPLLLASSVLLGLEIGNKSNDDSAATSNFAPRWNLYFTIICFGLLFAGLGQAVTRHRVRAIGLNWFFQYGPAEITKEGFFKGVHSGPNLPEINREVADVLQREHPTSIFFGPSMEWAYATFHKPSPTKQPVWWHPGVSYSRKDEAGYVQQFIDRKFDVVVLVKNGVGNMPQSLVQFLVNNYSVDQSYPMLTVLRSKGAAQ